MARLNTRTSATPLSARESTVDSLYRHPTPLAQLPPHGSVRPSSYSVLSPAQSMNSDKENETPVSREESPRPASKPKAMATRRGQRPPTPDSASTSARSGNKRRRTGDYTLGDSELYDDGDDQVHVYQDEDGARDASPSEDEDEDGGSRYYNPHQDPEKRRQLRANIRNHHRELEDNRDELIKPGNNLLEQAIQRQDSFMNKIRQTADAALDSRVLVLASDLAGKKLNASLNGNAGVGIDVDQFVSRCIFFMKEHRPASEDESAAPQTRRRHTQYDEDEDAEDTGEGLDWAFLGRAACFPNNKRPPLSSFLLGPLSLQRRARVVQSRRARSQRQPLGPATRPQELNHDDIKKSENSNLTHLVTGIKERLKSHINEGEQKIEQELSAIDDRDVNEDDMQAACDRHRVCQTPEGEAAVSLFDFVINPISFGQTVENLFYISFLIREGNAKVLMDDDGLPLLVPEKARTLQQQREQHAEKHQAIFSIDYKTWKTLVEAFRIKEPLIPHRELEETNISAGGWYG